MATGRNEGGESEEGAKAAPTHAQGFKGVPRDARRGCFELPLGLVHGGGSAHTDAEQQHLLGVAGQLGHSCSRRALGASDDRHLST